MTILTLDQPPRTLADARAERAEQGKATIERAMAHARGLRGRGHGNVGSSLLLARQSASDSTADETEAAHVLTRLALAHGVTVMGPAMANIKAVRNELVRRYQRITDHELPHLKKTFADHQLSLTALEDGQSRLLAELKPIEVAVKRYDAFLTAWETSLPQAMTDLVSAYGADALAIDLAAARTNHGELPPVGEDQRQLDDLLSRVGRVDPTSTTGKRLAVEIVNLRVAMEESAIEEQGRCLSAAQDTITSVETGDLRAIADLDRTVRLAPEAFHVDFSDQIEAAVLRAVEASGVNVFVGALTEQP